MLCVSCWDPDKQVDQLKSQLMRELVARIGEWKGRGWILEILIRKWSWFTECWGNTGPASAPRNGSMIKKVGKCRIHSIILLESCDAHEHIKKTLWNPIVKKPAYLFVTYLSANMFNCKPMPPTCHRKFLSVVYKTHSMEHTPKCWRKRLEQNLSWSFQ